MWYAERGRSILDDFGTSSFVTGRSRYGSGREGVARRVGTAGETVGRKRVHRVLLLLLHLLHLLLFALLLKLLILQLNETLLFLLLLLQSLLLLLLLTLLMLLLISLLVLLRLLLRRSSTLVTCVKLVRVGHGERRRRALLRVPHVVLARQLVRLGCPRRCPPHRRRRPLR